MTPVLNLSAYRFAPLSDLPGLQSRLHASAAAAGLRGTVLLAPEGINLFLAGEPARLRQWLADSSAAHPALAGLQGKESFSAAPPFRRLKVKIKAEIIRMNDAAVRPSAGRAPAVDAATLARWIEQGTDDAGRPLVLLDTRNAFEVAAGTFEGAVDWKLARFGDFPAAFDRHRHDLDGAAVVSFCTGGIRCEKAALYMRGHGLPQALQLEGGILGYFAATRGEAPGWRGRCFVFDERSALGADLAPAPEAAAPAVAIPA